MNRKFFTPPYVLLPQKHVPGLLAWFWYSGNISEEAAMKATETMTANPRYCSVCKGRDTFERDVDNDLPGVTPDGVRVTMWYRFRCSCGNTTIRPDTMPLAVDYQRTIYRGIFF